MIDKTYDVGIYCRLSNDDERDGESVSIENQKLLLQNYVRQRGWNEVDVYIDDGYSGTNFDRPGFNQLIADATAGKSIWYSARTSVVSAEIISKAASIQTSFFRASAAGSSPSMTGWTPLTKTMRCW